MSAVSHDRRTATIYRFPGVKPHLVRMASTVELCFKTHPTRQRLLMLLRMWLRSAEEHGVTLRQPDYAEALHRAIKALEHSPSVAHAIAVLRAQEAAVAGKASSTVES